MVSRLNTKGAVLPELSDVLVETVARGMYAGYVEVWKDVRTKEEEGIVVVSWDKLDEGLQLAWRAAARVAWQQIAIGGGAKVVRRPRKR